MWKKLKSALSWRKRNYKMTTEPVQRELTIEEIFNAPGELKDFVAKYTPGFIRGLIIPPPGFEPPTKKDTGFKAITTYQPATTPFTSPAKPYMSKYITKDIIDVCTQPIKWFEQFGTTTMTKDGHMIYKDNGADILFVGHLDTVQQHLFCKIDEGVGKIFASGLDDRLGVYLALYVLPKLGLKYDLLLTDSEEKHASTAKYFKVPEGKQYKWAFEIDRFGTDVALYKYGNQKEWVAALKKEGLVTTHGSFTDICFLEIGVAACNFACAYYNNHSADAYCKMEELDKVIENIVSFYNNNKDIAYPWKEEVKPPTVQYSYKYDRTKDVYDDYGWTEGGWWNGDDKKKKEEPKPTKAQEKDYLCDVCRSSDCLGLKECEECGLEMHSNFFVEWFGICKNCLNKVYHIDNSTLNQCVSYGIEAEDAVTVIVDTLFVNKKGEK